MNILQAWCSCFLPICDHTYKHTHTLAYTREWAPDVVVLVFELGLGQCGARRRRPVHGLELPINETACHHVGKHACEKETWTERRYNEY